MLSSWNGSHIIGARRDQSPATYIGDCHIRRKEGDLCRIAFLQLLKPVGRSRDKDNFVGRCEQGLGHSKANAAACAGNNDYLGFHVPSGKARSE